MQTRFMYVLCIRVKRHGGYVSVTAFDFVRSGCGLLGIYND